MAEQIASSSVPDFGPSYDKARKAYGLAAAVLLAWELIGIDLGEAPIESLNISLKSPQAAPYVLVTLVVYFAIRLSVEWFQADPQRRQRRASRFDFALAHVIGVSSLTLYAVQAILRVQVADRVSASEVLDFTIGWFLGTILLQIVVLRQSQPRMVFSVFGVSLVALTVVKGWSGPINYLLLGSGFVTGIVVYGLIFVLGRRRVRSAVAREWARDASHVRGGEC